MVGSYSRSCCLLESRSFPISKARVTRVATTPRKKPMTKATVIPIGNKRSVLQGSGQEQRQCHGERFQSRVHPRAEGIELVRECFTLCEEIGDQPDRGRITSAI
jgi:hypothetical protein